MNTIAYDVDGRIARITLERPERGNGITLEMPRELADCVERANLDLSETSPTARPRAHA
jgi:enoyl-CoA hydratase